jgi:positive regulator of sigma E activity
MKPGYKTTEFYLMALAMFLPLALASGLFENTSMLYKVIALGIAALEAIGYTAARAYTKAKSEQAASLLEAAKATGSPS